MVGSLIRLKRLRESKKLSHDKLSAEIEDRYGVHIDRKTLINYEKAETLSSKPEAVKGMNITRLTALADYYGVSTDYLLGVSDCPSIRKDVKVGHSKNARHFPKGNREPHLHC